MSNKIKEQLVSLALDLEDKEKVKLLLEKKIEHERSKLRHIEEDVGLGYRKLIQEEVEKHKHEAEKWNRLSQEAMSAKSELIEKLKDLMEEIKQTELDIQADVRRIYREGDQAIEAEKKKFKLGYEDRLQKFITQKAQEYKESTGRALEPEVSRLETIYERELSQLQQQFELEEFKIRDEYQVELQRSMEGEKTHAKEEVQHQLKLLQEKYQAEIDHVQYEEKYKMKALQEKLEKEYEKLQRQYNDKWKKYQQQLHEETIELQEASHQRIIQFQKKHYVQLENMHQEHDELITNLKKQHQEEIRKIEANANIAKNTMQQQRGGGGSFSDSEDEDGQQDALYPRSKHPTPTRRSFTSTSSLQPSSPGNKTMRNKASPTKGQKPKSKGTNKKSSDEKLEEDISQLSEELQTKVTLLRQEQEQIRDKRLQQEIRAQEKQLYDKEQDFSRKYEQERKKLVQLQQVEEKKLTSKQEQFTQEFSNMILQREECIHQVQSLEKELTTHEEEISTVLNEISVFKQGIQAMKTQLQSKEEDKKRQLREYSLHYQPTIRKYQEEQETLQQRIEQYEQQWQDKMKSNEGLHSKELAKLDTTVKQAVIKRDQQLSELKDEILGEKLAIEKLQLLINKYHPHGLATATTATSFGGTGESGLHVIDAHTTHQQLIDEEEDHHDEYRPPRNRVSEGYRKATSSSSIAQQQQHERREKETPDRDTRSVRSGSTISTATMSSQPQTQRPISALSKHARLNRTAGTTTPSVTASSSTRK